MLGDTLTRVSWRARPRSFVGLMGLYESSYIRLRSLAGDVGRLAGAHCSQVPGDCDLLLTVVDRSAYTSVIDLTYRLPGKDGPVTCPDLRLRVYHDARLVEAESWGGRQVQASLKAARFTERELHQRWVRNVMLNKWLEYCAERGHRFSVTAE